MGFESNFNMNDIIKNHEAFLNNVINDIAENLELTLRDLVNSARSGDYASDEDHKYKDRSGNLRQSVGFVIYHNGQMIRTSFGSGGNEGDNTGLSLAQAAATEIEVDGFVCVIVAGMHYARYVENKGFDVITGAFLHFDEFLKNIFSDSGININPL
ncbi:hypothetical protein CMU86_11670 [Elizabethkingia anophelis]|nr:hypothetical protein [Elizabethkingia anophelis]